MHYTPSLFYIPLSSLTFFHDILFPPIAHNNKTHSTALCCELPFELWIAKTCVTVTYECSVCVTYTDSGIGHKCGTEEEEQSVPLRYLWRI